MTTKIEKRSPLLLTSLLFLLVVFISPLAVSQVGINNTNPNAMLEISSSNVATPANTDGILIPKVDEFPSTNPTINQDGMLVFATGAGTPAKGFYYWDHGGTSWAAVSGSSSDADFYEIGGTSSPNNISDDQYTLGKLKIGQNSSANASLDIHDWNVNNRNGQVITRNLVTPSVFGQLNGFTSTVIGTSTDNYTSIRGELMGTPSVNSHTFYGSNTTAPSAGSSYQLYGLFSSNAGSGNLVGNEIAFLGGSITNTGDKSGFRTTIPTSLSGTHYGFYANVANPSGYAAYLIGRTSLGNSGANRYLMPATDGTAGQVMITDGSGQISFVDPSSFSSDSWTGGGTGLLTPATITDDVSIGSTSSFGTLTVSKTYTTGDTSIFTRSEGNVASGNAEGILNVMNMTGAVHQKGIVNTMTGLGTGSSFGVENTMALDADGLHFGFVNTFGGSGNSSTRRGLSNIFIAGGGTSTGLYNSIPSAFSISGDVRGIETDIQTSGIGEHVGALNYLSGSGSGDKYGTKTTIESTAGGTHYGVYADVVKSGSYAGYFLGNVYLGTNTTNGYQLPRFDGAANYIMQTDGAGQVSFVDPSTISSDSWTGAGTGTISPATITDNVSIGSGSSLGTLTVSKAYTTGEEAIYTNSTGNVLGGTAAGVQNVMNMTGTVQQKGVVNTMSGSGTGPMYGVQNQMTNTANGSHRAVTNHFSGTGTSSDRVGLYNTFTAGGGTSYGVNNTFAPAFTVSGAIRGIYNTIQTPGSGEHVGVYNNLTGSGSGDKYGTRTTILGSAGGTHYGIYSDVSKTGSFAGYFLGDLYIGTNASNGYTMPQTDGSANYIMQTDGAGQVSFVDPALLGDGTGTDDQNLTAPSLVGNALNLNIEGGTGTSIDLSPIVSPDVTAFALAQMHLSTNQVLTAGPGWTKVLFDTATIDIGSDFNTTSDRFIAPTAGYYSVDASFHSSAASADTGAYGIAVYVNGSIVKRNQHSHYANGLIHRNVHTVLPLSASDYVEIFVYRATAFTINSNNTRSSWEIERIR